MPIKDWSACKYREKIRMIPKKQIIQEGSQVTNKIEKVIYEFCNCDICLGEVVIKDYEQHKKNGAIIYYKTPSGIKFPIAVHTKCLKTAAKELNEFYYIKN